MSAFVPFSWWPPSLPFYHMQVAVALMYSTAMNFFRFFSSAIFAIFLLLFKFSLFRNNVALSYLLMQFLSLFSV